jgi:hypothetical protein
MLSLSLNIALEPGHIEQAPTDVPDKTRPSRPLNSTYILQPDQVRVRQCVDALDDQEALYIIIRDSTSCLADL